MGAVIKVRVGNTQEAETDEIRLAVIEAQLVLGERYPFEVTIDEDGRWSRPEMDFYLRDFDPFDHQYHPFGRSGLLAMMVAEETGGEVEYLVDRSAPEGAVP